MGLGDGDGRSEVDYSRPILANVTRGEETRDSHTVFLVDEVLESPRHKMTPWIHGHNLFLVCPLREGANIDRRFCVGKVGTMVWIQLLACQS